MSRKEKIILAIISALLVIFGTIYRSTQPSIQDIILIGDVLEYRKDHPVSYYGCPNSKRVRKLNLKKDRRKLK